MYSLTVEDDLKKYEFLIKYCSMSFIDFSKLGSSILTLINHYSNHITALPYEEQNRLSYIYNYYIFLKTNIENEFKRKFEG